MPASSFEITAPRCKVCQSPYRREIDMMLATGWSQRAVRDHFNVIIEEESDQFTPMNMSTHARKHLSSYDAAVRRIIEERAKQLAADVDSLEGLILTQTAVTDTIIHRGLVSMHKGDTIVEPKVLLEALDRKDKFDSQAREAAIDELMRDFQAFTEAVKDVVGEEKYTQIYAAFERKLNGEAPAALITPVSDESIELVAEELEEENN